MSEDYDIDKLELQFKNFLYGNSMYFAKKNEYEFELMRLGALKSVIGRKLIAMNPIRFDEILIEADEYLLKICDKDSFEHKQNKKNNNDKTNPIHNQRRKQKRIDEGTYVTREDAARKNRLEVKERNYIKVVEAIKACELSGVKPTVKKICEITGLGSTSVTEHRIMYRKIVSDQ